MGKGVVDHFKDDAANANGGTAVDQSNIAAVAAAAATQPTRAGKRPMKTVTAAEKIDAIRRVSEGESKASVARDIGVPESTLRGWCKAESKIRRLTEPATLSSGSNSPSSSSGAAAPHHAASSDEEAGPNATMKRARLQDVAADNSNASDDHDVTVVPSAAAAAVVASVNTRQSSQSLSQSAASSQSQQPAQLLLAQQQQQQQASAQLQTQQQQQQAQQQQNYDYMSLITGLAASGISPNQSAALMQQLSLLSYAQTAASLNRYMSAASGLTANAAVAAAAATTANTPSTGHSLVQNGLIYTKGGNGYKNKSGTSNSNNSSNSHARKSVDNNGAGVTSRATTSPSVAMNGVVNSGVNGYDTAAISYNNANAAVTTNGTSSSSAAAAAAAAVAAAASASASANVSANGLVGSLGLDLSTRNVTITPATASATAATPMTDNGMTGSSPISKRNDAFLAYLAEHHNMTSTPEKDCNYYNACKIGTAAYTGSSATANPQQTHSAPHHHQHQSQSHHQTNVLSSQEAVVSTTETDSSNNNNNNNKDVLDNLFCSNNNVAGKHHSANSPRSMAEALKHGEIFYEWLCNFNSPKVTNLEVMKLGYLLHKIKSANIKSKSFKRSRK